MSESIGSAPGTLAQLEAAERMLAEVATATDALNIIDLAEVARVYAREAKLGTSAINSATAIKLRAERKLADIVDEGQAKGEIATAGDFGRGRGIDARIAGIYEPLIDEPEPSKPATLDEIGLTSQRLSEARTIRDNYTDDDIDQIVKEADAADEVIARTDFVRKKAHVANNSGQNEWYTPAEYLDAARDVFKSDFGLDTDEDVPAIELDPASSEEAQKRVNAAVYYTAETNGLEQDWAGRVWMNPPYAQPLIGHFVDKLIQHWQAGEVTAAIVLVNNGTETKWGQKLLAHATHACFPSGRVKFLDPDGKPGAPLQGQMIVYFAPNDELQEMKWQLINDADYDTDPSAFSDVFAKFGPVLRDG